MNRELNSDNTVKQHENITCILSNEDSVAQCSSNTAATLFHLIQNTSKVTYHVLCGR